MVPEHLHYPFSSSGGSVSGVFLTSGNPARLVTIDRMNATPETDNAFSHSTSLIAAPTAINPANVWKNVFTARINAAIAHSFQSQFMPHVLLLRQLVVDQVIA